MIVRHLFLWVSAGLFIYLSLFSKPSLRQVLLRLYQRGKSNNALCYSGWEKVTSKSDGGGGGTHTVGPRDKLSYTFIPSALLIISASVYVYLYVCVCVFFCVWDATFGLVSVHCQNTCLAVNHGRDQLSLSQVSPWLNSAPTKDSASLSNFPSVSPLLFPSFLSACLRSKVHFPSSQQSTWCAPLQLADTYRRRSESEDKSF